MLSRPGVVSARVAPLTEPMRSFSARPVCPTGAMSVGARPVPARNKSAHDIVAAGSCRMVLQGMMMVWPLSVTVPPARRGCVGLQSAPAVSSVASWMNPVMSKPGGTGITGEMTGAVNFCANPGTGVARASTISALAAAKAAWPRKVKVRLRLQSDMRISRLVFGVSTVEMSVETQCR